MAIGILFAVLVVSAGFAILRCVQHAKGVLALGLAPASGLALLAVISTWSGLSGLRSPLPGAAVLVIGLAGASLGFYDRQSIVGAIRTLLREQRAASATLFIALLVPCLAVGVAFGGFQAPLSPHDGAFHVETIDKFRRGVAFLDWYPPGLAALFGASLQLMPWIDSAAGAYGLGLGLTLVAPLAIFGLGATIWRDLRAASAAALLVSFTYLFPYFPQVWGGWPQLIGVLLVVGLWTVAAEYLERPSWLGAVLAGLFIGSIVIVHGTELYTSAIVLLVLAISRWRRLPWRRLGGDLGLAVAIAAVCAAPYLPAVLHWAGAGGAYQAGLEDGTAMDIGARNATAGESLGIFTLDALGVDLPVRIGLLALGVVWALRQRTGRVLAAVVAIFVALAVIATFLNGVPIVRTVFAATYPWSLPFRHMTLASVPLALLAGGGCVCALRVWTTLLGRLTGATLGRVERLGRLLVVTWLMLATWALVAFLAIPRWRVASFSDDDAAAMAWLRQHASPADVVANDRFADAGIWAPYKAGVRILEYRSFGDPSTAAERSLVLDNVGQLDRSPAAGAAACALGVRYVYHGAQNSAWQPRQFPPVDELRSSAALEEVYAHGDAVVFATRLGC
jgi:hypothetical protein